MPSHPHSLEALAEALRLYHPRTAEERPETTPAPGRSAASVALVVRPAADDLEVLLIRRALFQGDPWAGHIALPGGRRSPSDRDAVETAVRETREEVGVDLEQGGQLLGRLDDVVPRPGAPAVTVSPFAFSVRGEVPLRLNAEVDFAVWAPLGELADPAAAREYLHEVDAETRLRFPAIGLREHLIWGITYRILSQLLYIAHRGPQREEAPWLKNGQ